MLLQNCTNIEYTYNFKDLFTLNESSGCVTHDQLNCDCNGVLLAASDEIQVSMHVHVYIQYMYTNVFYIIASRMILFVE